jgi:hypothetical protein
MSFQQYIKCTPTNRPSNPLNGDSDILSQPTNFRSLGMLSSPSPFVYKPLDKLSGPSFLSRKRRFQIESLTGSITATPHRRTSNVSTTKGLPEEYPHPYGLELSEDQSMRIISNFILLLCTKLFS